MNRDISSTKTIKCNGKGNIVDNSLLFDLDQESHSLFRRPEVGWPANNTWTICKDSPLPNFCEFCSFS